MDSIAFLNKFLRIKHLTSLFFHFKAVKIACRPFPILFYGRASARIDSSVKIRISSGSLSFNCGMQHLEPFIGFLKCREI